MPKGRDKDVDIGHIELKDQRLYVRVRAWKGKHHLDIRMHYEDKNGDWKPTKKGVSVPIVDEVPEEFFKLIQAADKHIYDNDL